MTKEQAITRIKHSSMYIDDKETADYIIKALEQPTSDDCVSRTQAIEWIENLRQMDKCFGNYEDDYFPLSEVIDRLKSVPPVTPTKCIATLRFSKEDLREICNERIEIACEHGTCKDCRHREGINFDDWFCTKHGNSARDDFYCADFEKRGDKNGN